MDIFELAEIVGSHGKRLNSHIAAIDDLRQMSGILMRGIQAQGEVIDSLEERVESLESLVRELVLELKDANEMVDVNIAAGVAHNTLIGVE